MTLVPPTPEELALAQATARMAGHVATGKKRGRYPKFLQATVTALVTGTDGRFGVTCTTADGGTLTNVTSIGSVPSVGHGVWIVEYASGKMLCLGTPQSADYAARMYRNAGFAPMAIATSTTIVPYDTVDYDYNSCLTTGSSAKYTAKAIGIVHVNAYHAWQLNNNPETIYLSIFKNAAEVRRGTHVSLRGGTAGDDWNSHVEGDVPVVVGDIVDVRVIHAFGGNSCTQVAGIARSFAEFRYA